ncbi:isochorismatase family protein [Motiliproteus sp. SC1-56]|uniref:isochorismatase family protein n=1 Tax=Motiliproteus sp. SC1-56 TaxID=2799565 RepID=UPI001A90A8B1|nr:isochorismatase family protein [Motiliproteus sp. SC1-56]
MKQRQQQFASFDIDAQNCFTPLCPAELPVPHGDEIVAQLNYQARFARLRIGSKDAHSPQAHWVADSRHPPLTAIEGTNMDLRWPVHAVPGTPGFELIDGLPRPSQYDFFVWKGVEPDMHPYGACYHDLAETLSTGVIEYLRQQQVRWIIAGGLATDYCVRTTVMQLRKAGFNVVVNLGACRGLEQGSTNEALAAMRGADVLFVNQAEELEHISLEGET